MAFPAGVADVDDDILLLGAGGQSEHTFAVHRFDGVVDEVGPNLVCSPTWALISGMPVP